MNPVRHISAKENYSSIELPRRDWTNLIKKGLTG